MISEHISNTWQNYYNTIRARARGAYWQDKQNKNTLQKHSSEYRVYLQDNPLRWMNDAYMYMRTYSNVYLKFI